MRRSGWLLAAAALLGAAAIAQAQDGEVERFERQLEQVQRRTRSMVDTSVPPGERVLVDYGAYTSFYFLAIDDPAQETHILRQYDLNGYAHLNLDGVHDFFVRVRTSYRDFNTGDSFDDHGDDWLEPTLDRATYRFDLRRFFQAYEGKNIQFNVIAEFGRNLVHWANGLVLSEVIDGGFIRFDTEDWALDVLAGVTRDSIVDFDSSRPNFSDDTRRGFFGGMFSYQVTAKHRPYAYVLVQRDFNDDGTLIGADDGFGPIQTQFEYNSYYIGAGSVGGFGDRFVYSVEAVFEGGTGLSNSFEFQDAGETVRLPRDQTKERIEAWALDAQLDYVLNDANHTRFSGELLLASGDDDRQTTSNTFGGNQIGTNDNAFNAWGLVNTGIAFNPNVSNIMMVRVGASTLPLPNSERFARLQVGMDVFIYGKMDVDGPIDEDTSDTRYLGTEADVYANWQLASDVFVALRYGVFFPGPGIATIERNDDGTTAVVDDDPRHFFFFGITLGF